jgi:MYXO-CTERM domain-containing protein
LKSKDSPTGAYQSDFGIFGNGTLNGTNLMSFGQNDVGLIDNLQASVYWSGLEADPGYAWFFRMLDGRQRAGGDKDSNVYAMAVRPGDVVAVPEADTWAMLLAGLGLVGVAARRRRG